MSGLWAPSFPSADLVSAAAGMFHGVRVTERRLGVTLDGRDLTLPSVRRGLELHPDTAAGPGSAADRELIEGPQWRLMVSPGSVSVRYQDPARAERAAQRAVEAARAAQDLAAARLARGLDPEPSGAPRVISAWSRKSRSRMVECMAQLDWSGLFTTDELPAMVTLTYPGDWLAVAPSAEESRRHLLALRKRFERFYGRRLVAVWKREFQRRGAPHYHLLMVPPTGEHKGVTFREWLSSTWASVVGHPDPEERRRHLLAGTGVDYADGVRARDPKSIGVYFSKHGSFASKDYQNDAPEEWIAAGSVGRFWGVWGLEKAVAGVLVEPVEGLAAARTLRRYSRANSIESRVPVWRYRTVVDHETGEVSARWRRSTKKARIYRVKDGRSGFLVTRDGPALAASVARHLDQLRRPSTIIDRSGAGPVGFLP